jgi:hypothetical protein
MKALVSEAHMLALKVAVHAHGTWFSMDIYDDDYILAEGEKDGMFKESLDKERTIGLK